MGYRVYIGKLAQDARRSDLEKLFKNYGKIEETTIKNGFGFVEFADKADAEDAVHDFHGTRFLGQRIVVELAMSRARNQRGGNREGEMNRIIVKNVAPRSTWQDLKDLMKQAGRVTFADILKDREGEGVVEFAHRKDMEYALRKLDNARLNGQQIILIEAGRRGRSSRSVSPSQRRRSRSRSRSRTPASRSRSRSPSPTRARPSDRRERSRRSSSGASRGSAPEDDVVEEVTEKTSNRNRNSSPIRDDDSVVSH